MSRKKLVIFGIANFAEIAHYYFSNDSEYEVVAFTVDTAYVKELSFQKLPVVPFETVEEHFPPDDHDLFIAMGFHKVNQTRAKKFAQAQAKNYHLASFISSKADVAPDLQIGANTMIMERACIQPFVKIGDNTIIWSTCRIGFHGNIGNHCWLVCPILGESVTVADYTFIGLNATIAPCVSIGKSNIIGAGALILNDTQDHQIYKGHPSQASRVPSYRLRNF